MLIMDDSGVTLCWFPQKRTKEENGERRRMGEERGGKYGGARGGEGKWGGCVGELQTNGC